MKKKLVAATVCVAVLVCCVIALAACNDDPVTPSQFLYDNSSVATDKTQIVFLGDSIAEGILGASPLGLRHEYAYPNLIGRSNDYLYYNHSVSGHLTKDLLSVVNNQIGYDGARMLISHVMTADVIHISIIGNDVLQDRNDFDPAITMHNIVVEAASDNYTSIDRALNGEGNIKGAISNIRAIVDRLRELNPDAVIVFQKVYNPIMAVDTPLIKADTRAALKEILGHDVTLEELHALGDKLIGRLNSAFDTVLAQYEAEGIENAFYTVDAREAFNAIYNSDPERAERLIYPDGIHPSNEGHAVLAGLTQKFLQDKGLANADKALAEYKTMRKNVITTYFSSSVDAGAVCADIDKATTYDGVTEVFFDATAGKLPEY